MRNFTPYYVSVLCLLALLFRQELSYGLPGPAAGKPPVLWNVRGTVVDEQGEPLPGVTVVLKGTSNGTTTAIDGAFQLRVPETAGVLVFSFVGFTTQERPFKGSGNMRVSLKADAKALEEVVVIGYGTVAKTDLTGSVGQVQMADLDKAPVASYTEALAGRVAGVQVSSSDGQPGVGMDIVIRGANSLTQDNSPLYVIDGFPIENAENAALNPDDIASITILKDASSTAIYGARGANGVVVIETKKGKIGRPVLTFNTSIGSQKLIKQMEVMNPYEFLKYQAEFNPTNANARYFTEGRTLESYRDVPGAYMQDYLFQTAPFRNYNLALRGGTPQTRYSLSGSINDQKGVVINSGFRRYQARASIDQTITKKVTAGVIVNYSRNQSHGQQIAQGAGSGSSFTTYVMSRGWGYRPVTGNANFSLIEDEADEETLNIFDIRLNPIITSRNEHIVGQTADLMGNAYVQFTLSKGLVFKTTGSASSRQNRNENFYNSNTTQGNIRNPLNTRGVWGSLSVSEQLVLSNENTLTYIRTLAGSHKLTTLAGFSQQATSGKYNGFSAQQVPNEELGMAGLEEGIPLSLTARTAANTLQSYFGRMDYNYKSRYLLTATFRADGSSKFASGNRWGYFPSAALAWNMHTESFMKQLPQVSNAKLRLSYGVSGNNRVSDFGYLPSLSMPMGNSYSFNNGSPTKGVIPSNLGNEKLKWESTTVTNLAYDLGLFKNKFTFSVELYRKVTSDLLLNAQLPMHMGFSSAFNNIGKIRNEGLELSLATVNISTPTFTWETDFNIGFNRNRILELTRGQEKLFSVATFESQYNGNPLYVAEVGQPAGMFYGYVFDGIYQLADFDNPAPGKYLLKSGLPANGNAREVIQPGDIRYRDLNGDGLVNNYDMTVIGRGAPLHAGGLVNNFTYKGFNLNVFFQWSYGNQVYNANRLMFEGNGNARTDLNQFASYSQRWTPENPSNTLFRAGGHGPIGMHSSRVLEDGSYLRLKTLSLGYNVPSQYLKRLYLSRLRLNVSGQNLLTFTKYSGVDPEVSVRNSVLTPGFDFSAYPRSRTLVLGANLTF